jgi:hypothetical protein
LPPDAGAHRVLFLAMTLLAATITAEGGIVLASDTREMDDRFYVRRSGRKLDMFGIHERLFWGFSGSVFLGRRVLTGVDQTGTHANEVLRAIGDKVWEVNDGNLPGQQVGILVAGFISRTPLLAYISRTGERLDDHLETVFLGSCETEAKTAWEVLNLVEISLSPQQRLLTTFRAITTSGSESIALPVDICTIASHNSEPEWERYDR